MFPKPMLDRISQKNPACHFMNWHISEISARSKIFFRRRIHSITRVPITLNDTEPQWEFRDCRETTKSLSPLESLGQVAWFPFFVGDMSLSDHQEAGWSHPLFSFTLFRHCMKAPFLSGHIEKSSWDVCPAFSMVDYLLGMKNVKRRKRKRDMESFV